MVSQLDALLTHLGTGWWSALHFIVLAFSAIFVAPHALGGAFMAPRLDYSCRVPITLNSTIAGNGSLLNLESSTSFSATSGGECHYTIDTHEGEEVVEDCVIFDFDNSTFSSTFTSEYHLACGRAYLQTAYQSVYMLGFFVAAPISGYLSDKYGRKPLVTIGYVCYLVVGVASAWLPLLSTILMARCLLGCFHFVNSYTTQILLVEVLEPKLRTIASFLDCNFWAWGMMLYGGLAYCIRDWRLLQTAITLPGLLILPALWMIDESPRWLIVNDRPEEALAVLNKVARWHRVELPPEVEMKKLVEEQASQARLTLQRPSVCFLRSFIDDVLVLLRTPHLRLITLCIYFDFLVAGMVYFGLALSGVNISNDLFVYMVLSGLMEMAAYNLIIPILQCFGRKLPLSVFFFTTSIILFALAVIPTGYSTTVLVLAMVGKTAITAGFQIIIFYGNELFPTEVRGRGSGTSAMMSRIGSMVSPFITDMMGTVYPWAPFILFGVGALLAGAGTLLLPETRGQILPDTVAVNRKVSQGSDTMSGIEKVTEASERKVSTSLV